MKKIALAAMILGMASVSGEYAMEQSWMENDFDEFNSYLTGLFYDGKLLSLHQSACDDGNGSVNNHIVRYKEGEYGLIIDKAFPELD